MEIFTRVVLERVIVFRNKEVIIAACIYIASRVENYPRTLDEISVATNITIKEITRIQKVIVNKLGIILCRLHPEHLLNRFCSRLQCNYQVNVLSKEICTNLLKYELLESVPPQIVISGVMMLSISLLGDTSIDVSRLLSVALINLSNLKLIIKQLLKLLKVVLPVKYQMLKPESVEEKLNILLNINSTGGSSNSDNKKCSGDQKKRDHSVAVSPNDKIIQRNNSMSINYHEKSMNFDNNNFNDAIRANTITTTHMNMSTMSDVTLNTEVVRDKPIQKVIDEEESHTNIVGLKRTRCENMACV